MILPTPKSPLKIGTRGSPLALAQAHETRLRLEYAFDLPREAFEITIIRTSGDKIQDRPLNEVGGKGLFTREIEQALLEGGIDLAVHSTKDMPVDQPEGLILPCMLPREDPRDAFVCMAFESLSQLPEGTKIGTSSLRRRAQLLHRFPQLQVVEFRGNVQTRLRKLENGVATATFLAVAGLNRLGMSDLPYTPISTDHMLPAVAQGAIGIECRENDARVREMLEAVNCAPTSVQIAAERAFLRALDGSCQTPIGGLAELSGGTITLRGEVLRPDGSDILTDMQSAPIEDAETLGHSMGLALIARAGPGFMTL